VHLFDSGQQEEQNWLPSLYLPSRWKLIDFDTSYDVSVVSEAHHLSATFRLTEEFAAPEVMKVVQQQQPDGEQESVVAVAATVVSEAMDIWSLGMVGPSYETLWSHLYPASEFHGGMVARRRSMRSWRGTSVRRRRGFWLSVCEWSHLTTALPLMVSRGLSLFTTRDSTVSANALVQSITLEVKIDRLSRLLGEYHSKLW
jgi:serine/threonine protein kinase